MSTFNLISFNLISFNLISFNLISRLSAGEEPPVEHPVWSLPQAIRGTEGCRRKLRAVHELDPSPDSSGGVDIGGGEDALAHGSKDLKVLRDASDVLDDGRQTYGEAPRTPRVVQQGRGEQVSEHCGPEPVDGRCR